ncbi:MarR family winged helix-turn-helix transcriptional regulator [Romboutsia sp.]|uniref:MarR family winged helix-turn-helix transcriptional regulator n=1 Tax=Romboutsia sp. TaxID=1965302 RepID=UPI003F2C238B
MNNKINEPIGKYVSQLYRKGNSFITKELSQYGIGSGQIMFLLQLYNKDGICQEELSENLNIDKGTTARAIKKLEEESFLIRLKDEQDKRAYKIYLTDKSKEIKSGVYEVLQDWDSIISKNITQEERDTLVNVLKKICINQNIK